MNAQQAINVGATNWMLDAGQYPVKQDLIAGGKKKKAAKAKPSAKAKKSTAKPKAGKKKVKK